MAIKTVNSISHNTDWTIGHVHSGALGWVSMISIGTIYMLIPRLFNKRRMYSIGMINIHFWFATTGAILYVIAMWVAGIMQGLMWRAIDDDGTLTYSFIEVVMATHPFYIIRFIGGLLFFIGMIVMFFNVYLTLRSENLVYSSEVNEKVIT